MKYKKVLVTGAAGFIGSHLTERLLELGCTVVAIDDLSEGTWKNVPKHPKLTTHTVSILDDISLVMRNVEVVFHLAALPRLQRSIDEPLATHNVNVNGTLNLLLAAQKNKVKRFVFSSSSSVYGNRNKMPFNESMSPHPLVPYSLHKVVGEEYCRLFADIWGLGTISLRYFNVYGPRMNETSGYANLIPKVMKALCEGKRPVINGDGKQRRDFTYISDVVEANILAAESDVSGDVFNIGYGKGITVNHVVKTLCKRMGKSHNPIYGQSVIEPRHTLASNAKAKRMLGWSPKVNFTDGITKVIQSSTLP